MTVSGTDLFNEQAVVWGRKAIPGDFADFAPLVFAQLLFDRPAVLHALMAFAAFCAAASRLSRASSNCSSRRSKSARAAWRYGYSSRAPLAAMTSIPMYLNTRAPHLKSLRDDGAVRHAALAIRAARR